MAVFGQKSRGFLIDIRNDGIYVILNNTAPRDKSIAQNAEMLLASSGIVNVDVNALVEAFSDKSERVERKISNITAHHIKHETVTVEISKDQMSANVKFTEPDFFGDILTEREITSRLKEAGVVFGLLTDAISRLPDDKVYGQSYLVAVGRPPIPGKDGMLEFHFDLNARNNRPKIMDDGRVDYKETNYILMAQKFEVLVSMVDPGPGKDGFSVLGQVAGHKTGKPAPRLPKGKNTFISEDGKDLVAEIAGQIMINNKRVEVLPILEIKGDVGNETGNINFAGSVFVLGNVTSDFTIKATGDIEVKGAVEGAIIEAGGNVNMLGGIKGMGRGIVKAGGSIFARYAERATLIAYGNIAGESFMHSDIKTNGSIKLEGKNGLLVGGSIYAGKNVSAKVIGSSMATATDITVGYSPEVLDRYRELDVKHKQLKAEYDKENLQGNYKSGTEDMRLRSMHVKIHLRVEMDKVIKEMNELLILLNENKGMISASQTIYSGVKAIIGGSIFKVTDEIYACTLRNDKGKVVKGVCSPNT